MRMKMYTADTLDEARKNAFSELGDDAVILSEKKTDSGFQIRAAVNKSYSGRTVESLGSDLVPNQALNEIYNGPAIQRLRDTLSWHGVPERYIRKIVHIATKHVKTDYGSQFDSLLTAALGEFCKFSQIEPADQNLILVGPPGHGRTACLAKLIKRMPSNGPRIIPIAADLDATAGADQLRAYLEGDNKLVESANTPQRLFAILKHLDAIGQRYIIDLPAIVPFDAEDLARLSDLLAVTNAKPVLVISAEGFPEDQIDIVKRFASVGVREAIVTKLDMTQRRGGIVTALALNKVDTAFLSSTPFIGRGLVEASPESVASLFFDESERQMGLRGAA